MAFGRVEHSSGPPRSRLGSPADWRAVVLPFPGIFCSVSNKGVCSQQNSAGPFSEFLGVGHLDLGIL